MSGLAFPKVFHQRTLLKNSFQSNDIRRVNESLEARGLTNSDKLLRIVPSPSIVYEEGGDFHGAGYEVFDDMEARHIMRSEDLCAGVSAYRIRGLPKIDARKARPHEYTRLLGSELSSRIAESDTGFRDYSLVALEEIDGVHQRDRTTPVFEPHLGRVNCSISVERYTSDSDERTYYILVVRSYDVVASSDLLDYINSLTNGRHPTVKDVYYSKVYKDAKDRSQLNRDTLAAAYAASTGISLEDTSEEIHFGGLYAVATPFVTNFYNVIHPFHRFEHRWSYIYYDHCYATSEAKDGILFGRGRSHGYTLIKGLSTSSDRRWENEETINIFPMGYPQNRTRSQIVSSGKKIPSDVRNKFAHGCFIDVNHKMDPTHHHNYHTTPEWHEMTHTLGLKITTEDSPWYAVHSYISAQDPHTMPLEEIYHYSPDDEKWILVPIGSHFSTHEMMLGFVRLRKMREHQQVTLRDIWRGEVERGYYKVNKEYAQLIHSTHPQ